MLREHTITSLRARHATIRERRAEGCSLSAIAQELHVGLKTLRLYLDTEALTAAPAPPPAPPRPRPGSGVFVTVRPRRPEAMPDDRPSKWPVNRDFTPEQWQAFQARLQARLAHRTRPGKEPA